MKFLILILLTMSFNACGMGGKPRRHTVRKDQDKLWRPCQDNETESPVGKLCSRHCLERKSKSRSSSCKVWETKVRDFTKANHFHFFRAGSFIFIDEDNL